MGLCIFCQKNFTQLRNLTRHQTNMHGIEPPEPEKNRKSTTCATCGQRFSRATVLRRHQARAHGPSAVSEPESAGGRLRRTNQEPENGRRQQQPEISVGVFLLAVLFAIVLSCPGAASDVVVPLCLAFALVQAAQLV